MFRTIAALVVLLSLAGCTHTRVVSERDPAIPLESYDTVLVEAVLGELATDRAAEDNAVKELTRLGYHAMGVSELFFSQREYDDAQRAQILDDNGVEAILIIEQTGSGFDSEFIPASYVRESRTEIEADGSARSETVEQFKEAEQVDKPWAVYEARLFDLRDDRLVWYAEAEANAGRSRDHHDLGKAASGELARRLADDEMLGFREGSEATGVAKIRELNSSGD